METSDADSIGEVYDSAVAALEEAESRAFSAIHERGGNLATLVERLSVALGNLTNADSILTIAVPDSPRKNAMLDVLSEANFAVFTAYRDALLFACEDIMRLTPVDSGPLEGEG